jgi:dipeptidyl aminopeptidase/acylaminoacyl peptidase
MKSAFIALALGLAIWIPMTDLGAQPVSPVTSSGKSLVPVEDFFRAPNLIKPVLSPDGRFVAVGMSNPAGRLQLAVLDLANLKSSKVIASFDDADVADYHWVNAERLVLSVTDRQSADRPLGPGLWGVNRDGSDFRYLIKNVKYVVSGGAELTSPSTGRLDRVLSADWSLHSTLSDGSADILVEAPQFDRSGERTGVQLSRLNTETGRIESLTSGAPGYAYSWVVDRKGQPATVTTWSKGRYASYLNTDQGWKQWEESDGYSANLKQPYWIGPNNELLVVARNGADTSALFELDRTTLKLADKPLVNMPGYDFRGGLVVDAQAQRLMGVHVETDARGTAWLDAGMRELQGDVDKLLPATVNRIDCQRCVSVPTFLVTASSDRLPPTYYLYHRDTRKIERLGASRPWIKPEQMGLRDMYRFAARDGLSIPVLVTQPPGKAAAPRPAVVLVHGGPWVRGSHWDWERDAQFLASRGYVVIEPEFRGSKGYGDKHFRAGWKQWGLAMQDDVSDSVQWAVKQGWVDAGRVCIAGASYGGYAVLMGLIKNPELYQCGIDWVGVSDINLMYSINWSDSSEEWKRYGMPRLIGDPVEDAQQLKDTSPLEQASRLKRPLLMAYGHEDRRVPVKHGEAFRDAVKKTNPDLEWVVYLTEGHGWWELATNVDFWTRVEKFLDKHIGPSAPAPAALSNK